MKIRLEQLDRQLARQLAPIYMVFGDEPLLVQEAADKVRAAAREQGCNERQVLSVDKGFDWGALNSVGDTMSLFSERRIIELRMPSAKPGQVGAKALTAYAQRPPQDAVMLVISAKLDMGAQKSKWFAALEQAGVVIQVWPVDKASMHAWIDSRMRDRGMVPSQEAIIWVAAQVEGNLLACAQEIEKLLLLYGAGPIDVDAIAEAVTDSARFDIYKLVDCALEGDGRRTVRMLESLRREGVEPVLVLWAIAREVRSLAAMAYSLEGGARIDQVLSKHGVWERRKASVKHSLKRHRLRDCHAMLRWAGRIDRIIKGFAPGNAWEGLLQLSLFMAGIKVRGRASLARC